MSISNSYPTQRPSLNLVFNGGSDQLDSRISFSRADTPPTYAAPSAVHYWSNEKHLSSLNLLTYSTAFDNAAWGTNNMPAPTTGQTDPSGGTGGCILIADTTNGSHNKFQSQVTSGDLSFTVYAKPASGTMRMMLNLYNAANDWEVFLFDLVGGTPVAASGTSSTFANVSATQTASGNGYYKCTIKATGSITSALVALNPNATTSGLDAYGDLSFAGDDTAGITVAFASLSTVGSSDYNATTSQIHREYSSTLKSVSSSGQPRFEYSPADGQSAGTALGLLVESQATNLQRYGSAFASWGSKVNLVTHSNQAIAPNGELEADLLVPTSGNDYHYIFDGQASVASGTTYTFSVYLKSAGYRYVQLLARDALQPSGHVAFDLEAGTLSASGAHTGTIESVGNGWFRASATVTATSTTTSGFLIAGADSLSNSRNPQSTGNAYDGLLAWGAQLETGSAASSLANSGTSSSGVTRAADSCSVDLDGILADGQDVTLYAEGDFGDPAVKASNRIAVILQQDSGNYINLYNGSGYSGTGYINYGGVSQADWSGVTTGEFKAAVSAKPNSFNYAANGIAGAEDTSGTVPNYNSLHLGEWYAGTLQLDGTLKRVTLYGQALSSTELAALTS